MVTQLDSGNYTVQASNDVGMGMISFMLQVEGKMIIDQLILYCNIKLAEFP